MTNESERKIARVLIVDDSTVFRSQLRLALAGLPQLELVDSVTNGKSALARLSKGDIDIAIVDLEMPEMNGLALLEALVPLRLSTKIIVFASATPKNAENSIKALNLGAFDFVLKPGSFGFSSSAGNVSATLQEALGPKLKLMVELVGQRTIRSAPLTLHKEKNWNLFNPKALVIASSTGGPRALDIVFNSLQMPPAYPTFLVQHMPPLFTQALADRIQKQTGRIAREAKHEELVEDGVIYVCPGDYHMRVRRQGPRTTIELDRDPTLHSVRPAADYLFSSAAEIYREQTLGLVLTGMGEDGKRGCQAIFQHDGAVVIQNEATCTVYGMPKAVFDSGCFNKNLPLEDIGPFIRGLSSVLPTAVRLAR